MLDNLLAYQKEIANIQYTINLLTWELRINAPKDSKENLIELISYYQEKVFKLQTSDKYERLLKNTIASKDFKTLDESEQRYI